MAEVYMNGDTNIIHALDSKEDAINNEEIVAKQANITKDISIEKHDELNLENSDSNDSNDTYDINDNSELRNSVANEESSPFKNITELNNDISDISETNTSEKSNLTNYIKTDNIKLAANFESSSVNVPSEISLSSTASEAAVNKDVVEPSDEVAAIVDSNDSTSNSYVSDVNGEPVLISEDDLSAIKMHDSHINTVDNIPLTESYIKISLDGNNSEESNGENTNSESTVLVDLGNDLASNEEDTTGTTEINEDIADEGDTSDDISIKPSKEVNISEAEITSFVADIIEFAVCQHASITESTAADHEEEIIVESISALEASKDDLQGVPIDLTRESSNSGTDVLDKESVLNNTSAVPDTCVITEQEEETISFDSKPIFVDDDSSSPIEYIDLTTSIERIGEDKSNPIQIIDDVDEIIDNSTSSTKVIDSTDDTKSETVHKIDSSESIPAGLVDTLTSESKVLDSTSTPAEIVDISTSQSNVLDATSVPPVEIINNLTDNLTSEKVLMEDDGSASKVVDDSIPIPIPASDNPKSDPVETLDEVKSTIEIIDSPSKDTGDSKSIPADTVNDSKIDLSADTPASKIETAPASAETLDVVAEASGAPEDEWLDILGNGFLKKKIIVQGKGKETRPPSGGIVNVRCEGKLEDGTVVDKHDNLQFILSDEDVIQAFDLAIALMEDKETAIVFTDARYAYGIHGRRDFTPPIPQNASITYEIEILSVEDGPDLEKLTDEERLTYGDKKRIRGNDLHKRGEYSASINSYKRGIKYLEGSDDKNVMAMKIKCLNNLSAAELKVKAYKMAVQSLDVVLRHEPENVKALFRKGKCLDGMKKEEEALECIKKASMLDPNNKSITQELGRLKSRVAVTLKKEKEMYQKMFTSKKEEKLTKEEQDRNWIFNLTCAGVGALAIVLGWLSWKR